MIKTKIFIGGVLMGETNLDEKINHFINDITIKLIDIKITATTYGIIALIIYEVAR